MEFPAASAHAVVKQRVGLTDVEVDYSRPNKNNRNIFGGLVLFDKPWRTGANQPTKIKVSGPVKLGNKEVPAGEYVLYTIPGANCVDGHSLEESQGAGPRRSQAGG